MHTNRKTIVHISPTWEDYIREIYLASIRHGVVRVTDIAHNLNLARSTVSERIKDLEKAKLVKPSASFSIVLTKKGDAIARHLTYKHRLIEVFLHKTLGMSAEKVHAEAHKLEHAFSDDVINRLDKFLGNPKVDPHGKIIKKV